MSFRDIQGSSLQNGISSNSQFQSACTYANFLWAGGLPARAILALCRAVYLRPESLPEETRQPYKALVWILQNYKGKGFLGNPRISFIHQATRIPEGQQLKRNRAWAMWFLSRAAMPQLRGDPKVQEHPPSMEQLRETLDQNGLTDEGSDWMKAMTMAQEAGPEASDCKVS